MCLICCVLSSGGGCGDAQVEATAAERLTFLTRGFALYSEADYKNTPRITAFNDRAVPTDG